MMSRSKDKATEILERFSAGMAPEYLATLDANEIDRPCEDFGVRKQWLSVVSPAWIKAKTKRDK